MITVSGFNVRLARTPLGAFRGQPNGLSAPVLGNAAIDAAPERAKVRHG